MSIELFGEEIRLSLEIPNSYLLSTKRPFGLGPEASKKGDQKKRNKESYLDAMSDAAAAAN